MFNLVFSDSVMSEWTVDVDRRIYKGIQIGMDRGFIQKGDPVIIITGWKPGSGSTNTMRIINAVDVANKDLLAPITGNPSFWLCCHCCFYTEALNVDLLLCSISSVM